MQSITPYRGMTPLMPFLYTHAGYSEMWDKREFHDPGGAAEHLRVHEGGGRQGLDSDPPAPGSEPQVFIFTGANPLRRWPAPQIAREAPVAEARPDRRRQLQGQHLGDEGGPDPADRRLLRARLAQVQPGLPALPRPVREGGRAARRGEAGVGDLRPAGAQDPGARPRARRQQGARLRSAARSISPRSTTVEPRTGSSTRAIPRARSTGSSRRPTPPGTRALRRRRRPGCSRSSRRGEAPIRSTPLARDYRPGRTLYPHARFVEGKEAWPTFSGRQQFLIDHPWYEEVGEALPVHKEPPMAGGDYPLRLTGGHTRWSIHATWRDVAADAAPAAR